MPNTDLADILLGSDAWATRQMLSACASLSDEQWHQRFNMGFGSLHDTLVHMVAATRAWADTLAQRPRRPRLEGGPRRSVAEVTSLFEEAFAEYSELVRAHPISGILEREVAGRTYQFSRAEVLAHVATHGMHHRSQCLNMLRQVGVTPLPESAVFEWVRAGEPR